MEAIQKSMDPIKFEALDQKLPSRGHRLAAYSTNHWRVASAALGMDLGATTETINGEDVDAAVFRRRSRSMLGIDSWKADCFPNSATKVFFSL